MRYHRHTRSLYRHCKFQSLLWRNRRHIQCNDRCLSRCILVYFCMERLHQRLASCCISCTFHQRSIRTRPRTLNTWLWQCRASQCCSFRSLYTLFHRCTGLHRTRRMLFQKAQIPECKSCTYRRHSSRSSCPRRGHNIRPRAHIRSHTQFRTTRLLRPRTLERKSRNSGKNTFFGLCSSLCCSANSGACGFL